LTIMGWLVGTAGAGNACSPATYMTFFGFESAELSPLATATINKMVGHKFTTGLPAACVRVLVVGHADTAEAATPDRRVDIARAEAVRAAIVREGVPADMIETRGAMGR